MFASFIDLRLDLFQLRSWSTLRSIYTKYSRRRYQKVHYRIRFFGAHAGYCQQLFTTNQTWFVGRLCLLLEGSTCIDCTTYKLEFGDLERIAFPEYSEHFPHAQYTLGLNGRPSGPDFYINSMDNSVPHGPSGHQKDGYAEPCFAKVIIGKETVDLIAELPNKHDDEFLLQHAIQIVHVKLIKDLQNMAGGPEYLAIQA